MGKLKKPPKNAYFFFVMSEKEKAEAEGYRVQGGFQIYSRSFGYRWTTMTKEEKAPYEVMAKEAKEEEKYNINNKFTVTGESYAQVHQNVLDKKTAQEEMDDFIYELVSGPDSGDRQIIFMKALYSVEEIIDKRSKLYWPSELSMATFSLKGGIKSIYTQLVDTDTIPTGYASQAKENCSETLLPMPGNRSVFSDECRDYLRILKNINGFANHWLKDGYDVPGHRKVFFALENEVTPLVSCLQWMVNQLDGKEREKYQRFVDNLKVYRISKLILTMAEEANRANPSYQNYLVQFKLETAADAVVMKGNYDYCEEIVCGYHRLDIANMKMHNCAQSIVMRRIFMLFLEFVPAYKYEWNNRHKVDKLGKGAKGPVIKRKREKSPVKEEVKIPEPSWLKSEDMDMDTFDYGSGGASGISSVTSTLPAWGERSAPPASFEEDDFPTLGASGGTNSTSTWERRSSTSSASRSPPRSSNSFGLNSGGGGAGGGRGRRPGPPPPASSTSSKSFLDNDDDEFPSLGSNSAGRGRGRRY